MPVTNSIHLARIALNRGSALSALALAVATSSTLIAVPAVAQEAGTSTTGSSASPGAAVPATPETVGQSGDAGSAPDEIVVTGSRIARPDLQASSPVAVVSGEAFKTQNSVTVEQLLQVNPQFVADGGASSNNNGSADGAATADLRGLGSQRTLVLIDGKRAPTYDVTGSVDLNTIPTSLIKRVDVLTGGASAVYGSDAVAGVVNFILDDRFVGLRTDASAQITQRGDGGIRDISLTGGAKIGDRGNLVVSGDYSKRDGIFYSARPRLAESLDSVDFTPTGSSNTVPTAFNIPGRPRQQVTDSGDLVDYYQPYNTNPVNYVFIPLQRYSAMALGRYELTDNIEAYFRGNYERIKTDTQLAPTATAGFSFDIHPDNPFLTPSERDAFFNVAANPALVINPDGSSTINIRRRIVETGGRLESHKTTTYQFVGGLRGSLGSNFKFDVFGQYGHVRKNEILSNDISYTTLQQSLDAVAGPNGTVVCRNPANGCVPTNLFTTAPITSDALGFFIKNASQVNTIEQTVAGANVSGDLSFLKSPFADGSAAISVGVEYRKEKGVQTVDPFYASGDLIYYGQGQNARGSYNTKEAYIEFKMPLVQDKPFIQSLNVEAGFRYSDYSTVGSIYTYKAGGDWSPISGVRFRGIYQRAVRAPNLYELFSTKAAATGNLNTDPCAGPDVDAGTADICAAQIVLGQLASGQTANPVRAASLIGTIPDPILGQINVITSGNQQLDAEKTDTVTLGVVINPPQLPALSLSVDYYHIKIANAIDVAASGDVLNQCFNVDQDAASPACNLIIRNALDGSLSGNVQYGVITPYQNINRIKTDGIDVSVGYHGGTKEGFNYAVSFAGTYLRSFKKNDNKCAGLFGDICGYEPLPKWKHVADLVIGYKDFNFDTRWRLVGKVHGDADMVGIRNFRLKAVSYFDETVSVNIAERYTLRLGIQNLLDKKPPLIGDTAGAIGNLGNTFPDIYDILGRTFFAGVSAKF